MFISYFRVYRPLTPPYVPFGIRRFLTRMQFLVIFRKCGIMGAFQVLFGYSTCKYGTMNRTPIPLSGVSPLPCLPLRYATSLQILEACPHSFPTFPYTHTYAAAQPFIRLLQKIAHLGKPKVVNPPSDCIGQFLLALLVAPTVTARRQFF